MQALAHCFSTLNPFIIVPAHQNKFLGISPRSSLSAASSAALHHALVALGVVLNSNICSVAVRRGPCIAITGARRIFARRARQSIVVGASRGIVASVATDKTVSTETISGWTVGF